MSIWVVASIIVLVVLMFIALAIVIIAKRIDKILPFEQEDVVTTSSAKLIMEKVQDKLTTDIILKTYLLSAFDIYPYRLGTIYTYDIDISSLVYDIDFSFTINDDDIETDLSLDIWADKLHYHLYNVKMKNVISNNSIVLQEVI